MSKKKGDIHPVSVRKIKSVLGNKAVRISLFESVDSTNSEARRQAELGLCVPALIISDHQSAGRGRLGRSFYSPLNTGLYMSLLLKAKENAADNVQLTTAAAVAAARSIEEVCGIEVRIKWVNDLYLGSKKICGILCESFLTSSGERYVIIGVGVNLWTENFPQELDAIATSLMPNDVRRDILAADIAKKLLDHYAYPDNTRMIEYYRTHSAVLGKKVRFEEGGKGYVGLAESIDVVGRLNVRIDEQTIKILSSGEISLKIDE